jgi:hypothetical protein
MSDDDVWRRGEGGSPAGHPPDPAVTPGPPSTPYYGGYAGQVVPVAPQYPVPAPAPYAQPAGTAQPIGTAQPTGTALPIGTAQPIGTNGLAVASLVTSLLSVVTFCGPIGIAGAVLGHVARSRIRVSGEDGDDMARAGIVLGWAWTAVTTVAITVGILWLSKRL